LREELSQRQKTCENSKMRSGLACVFICLLIIDPELRTDVYVYIACLEKSPKKAPGNGESREGERKDNKECAISGLLL
jgi:hypothetical protein